jgi:uncharacterized membrane protein
MYGSESAFWLELVFLLAIFILLVAAFNATMRKRLNVEKKKFFSYNHVNDKHRKIDWTIRIAFMGVLLIGFFVNITRDFADQLWFLQT